MPAACSVQPIEMHMADSALPLWPTSGTNPGAHSRRAVSLLYIFGVNCSVPQRAGPHRLHVAKGCVTCPSPHVRPLSSSCSSAGKPLSGNSTPSFFLLAMALTHVVEFSKLPASSVGHSPRTSSFLIMQRENSASTLALSVANFFCVSCSTKVDMPESFSFRSRHFSCVLGMKPLLPLPPRLSMWLYHESGMRQRMRPLTFSDSWR